MLILTKLIGLLIVIIGVLTLINNQLLKDMCGYFMVGKRLYFNIILKMLIGFILLFAASQARSPGIIITFGLLYVLGPIVGLFLGLDKLKAICQWFLNQSLQAHRVWAVAAVIFGALIIFAA